MFGLFSSIGQFACAAAEIAVAPVEVVATLANAVVKPVAEGAEALVKEVKDLVG